MALPGNIGGGAASVGSLVGFIVADTKKWTAGLKRATTALKGFSSFSRERLEQVSRSMRRVGIAAGLMGAAITAGLGKATKAFGNFDKAMRRATAVSDLTTKQFRQMSNMAEETSIRLNIAATEAASVFFFLGSAGLKATEQMEAFNDVLNFAKAGSLDTARAAEILVDTTKGLGLSFSEVSKTTDIMVQAYVSASLTLEQLGESMSLVAGLAKKTNTPLEEVAAAFGLMADAGIKSSRAGTTLRFALLNLGAGSVEAKEKLQELQVEAFDETTGRMKSFVKIITEVSKALQGMGEEQQLAAVKAIFGRRAIVGMLKILDQGTEALEDYVAGIKDSAGATQKIVDKQMKAFNEKAGQLNRTLQQLSRTIGAQLAPALEGLFETIRPGIQALTDWVKENERLVTVIVEFTAVMGVFLVVGGTVLILFGSIGIAVAALGVGLVPLLASVAGLSAAFIVLGLAIAKAIKRKLEIAGINRRLTKTLEGVDEAGKNTIKMWEDYRKVLAKTSEGSVKAARIEEILNLELDRRTKIIQTLKNLQESGAAGRPAIPSRTFRVGFGPEQFRPGRISGKEEIEIQEELLRRTDNTIALLTKRAGQFAEKMKKAVGPEMQEELNLLGQGFKKVLQTFKSEFEGGFSDFVTDQIANTVEGMTDEFSDGFSDIIMGTESVGDAFGNMLRGMTRRIADFFADMIAQRLLFGLIGDPFAQGGSSMGVLGGALGGLFPGLIGARAGAATAGAPGRVVSGPGGTGPIAAPSKFGVGGLVTNPTIGLIGESGPEAVVPLSGGRSIPVIMKGGGPPSVEVNIINQSRQDVGATRGRTTFDGRRLVTEVILQDLDRNGPIRAALKTTL